MTALSRWFDTDDFTCKTGEPVPAELLPNLQQLHDGVLIPIREGWGPVNVVCGYRSPEYNAMLFELSLKRAQARAVAAGVDPSTVKGGVAKDSEHETAGAADIRPNRISELPRFLMLIERMKADGKLKALGGLGWYPGLWIHVGLRPGPGGRLRRWEGSGAGSER